MRNLSTLSLQTLSLRIEKKLDFKLNYLLYWLQQNLGCVCRCHGETVNQAKMPEHFMPETRAEMGALKSCKRNLSYVVKM